MNLLTTTQVANRIKANPHTIKRMCQDGRIKAVNIGNRWLIEESEIMKITVAHRGWPAGKKRKKVEETEN